MTLLTLMLSDVFHVQYFFKMQETKQRQAEAFVLRVSY
jgi:hypothetical protein